MGCICGTHSKMTRRRFTTKQNIEFFLAHNGECHICGGKIDAVREKWEREHVIPIALGGADDDSNMRPAHVKCHREKTDGDVAAIAKARRREAKHMGAQLPKRKIQSRGFGQFKSNVKYIDRELNDEQQS